MSAMQPMDMGEPAGTCGLAGTPQPAGGGEPAGAPRPVGAGEPACALRPAKPLRWQRARSAVFGIVHFISLMVAVSFVTFALVANSPIDPVQANVGQAAYASMSPERRAELAERWEAETPLVERYASWLTDALHGDFGESLRFNAPVTSVVAERLGASLGLLAAAWVISSVLGTVLGIAAGARRGSAFDWAVRAYCYLLSATPTFWLALIALMVFSVYLGWFPLGFAVPIGATGEVSLAVRLHHMALPALVLSLTGVANVALHTREKLIEVLAADYVRFALARGESRASIVLRHGVRNVVLPAITLACAQVGEIVGGSILVEQVFSYPGFGQAAVTAGLGGDAPLLVAIALVTAALVFAGNALANVLYGIVDPRLGPRHRAGVCHGRA